LCNRAEFISAALISLRIFANFDPIVVEFIFGIIAGLLFLKITSSHLVTLTSVAVFIVGCTFLFVTLFWRPEISRVVLFGIPSFFIVLSAACMPQGKNSMLKVLGDASYSIYLIQIFTIPAFYKFAKIALGGLNDDVAAVVCLFLYRLLRSARAQVCRKASKS
jgi:exopolysaccharide production protein ExoZ